MSSRAPVSKNRYHEATQWIQVGTTLLVLLCVYTIQGSFGSNSGGFFYSKTPPSSLVEQKVYWNDWAEQQLSSEERESVSTVIDSEGAMWQQQPDGMIYQDDVTKISFHAGKSLQEGQEMYNGEGPRAYITLPQGLAIIEGNLSSGKITQALTTLAHH